MNTQNLALALQILYDLGQHITNLSAAVGRAIAEGRDVTDEELNTFASADDMAKVRLQKEIDAQSSSSSVATLDPLPPSA